MSAPGYARRLPAVAALALALLPSAALADSSALTPAALEALKAAQWLQVIEAYSMIVTGASARPSTMSGSGGAAFRASSAAGVSALESASAAEGSSASASAATAGRRRA